VIHRGLITALRTLTIIPIPGKGTRYNYLSLPWFSVVGAGIGLTQLLAMIAIYRIAPEQPFLGALFVTFVNFYFTGGLHIDGLADTADAFGTPQTKEKTLAILKDPHLGAFGTAAMTLGLLWRTGIYAAWYTSSRLLLFTGAFLLSRIIQGILLSLLPYARGSQGKASGFRGPWWVLAILFLELSMVCIYLISQFSARIVLLPLVLGVLGFVPICFRYVKGVGGITGDGIGACTEIFELLWLTTFVIMQQI